MRSPKHIHVLPLLLFLLAPFSTVLTALKLAAELTTIEYTAELIAARDYFHNATATFTTGGVATLVQDKTLDLASNAETQALRQFATHKNLRIIYTVCEVAYRLVARTRSGVASARDLKGKKIGTFPGTSGAYFVQRYMASVGLKASDYTVVSGGICRAAPCGSGTLPAMLASGAVDAVGLWEPTMQLAIDAVGVANVVVFQDKSVYRELFNLHSTAEKLKDATARREIVAFVRALAQAQKVFAAQPETVWPRVAAAVGVSADVVKAVWPVHGWGGGLPADLLDVLVAEDQWVAGVDRRAAMSRAVLADLVDGSVLKEALAG
ncbi:hypothetical protein B0T22DRAFT_510805 [Podospora appendiculata]|uniref:SsuA/THI5-like domain-containing protein n=1 Tax=Podospora appendiculata TaxID=314037 RepID=A0AAE0X8N2_9PEZI|nr:hypothetical protein B0T22DRAFT_510805 [Podospora appendiculata]